MAYEAFNINYDVTTINQDFKITEIHQPGGKNDILQQIEHGVLSVIGAYLSLGRSYRGIICSDLRQYVHLGDSASMTDGIKGNADDRLMFTENNPERELTTAAHLAAASRALKDFNNTLSIQALQAACEIFKAADGEGRARSAKIHAAVELFLTIGEKKYKDFLLTETEFIAGAIDRIGRKSGKSYRLYNRVVLYTLLLRYPLFSTTLAVFTFRGRKVTLGLLRIMSSVSSGNEARSMTTVTISILSSGCISDSIHIAQP